jgi:hypothetical protein
MKSTDERIAKAKARVKQLERQEKAELAREREQKRRQDERRKFIIGETVVKYFSDILPLTIDQSADERETQISLFESGVAAIAANQALVQQIKTEISQQAFRKSQGR